MKNMKPVEGTSGVAVGSFKLFAALMLKLLGSGFLCALCVSARAKGSVRNPGYGHVVRFDGFSATWRLCEREVAI